MPDRNNCLVAVKHSHHRWVRFLNTYMNPKPLNVHNFPIHLFLSTMSDVEKPEDNAYEVRRSLGELDP
jgi:hypothetical protein